jgi:cation:H+ antiporter
VIGLTIVALGTSLPELVTSVVASIRGARDIAVGNIVGSNLFNILAVLGAAGALSPDGVAVSETALRLDMPVMIIVAVACLPIFFTGNRIARWEGGLFLGYYAAYIAFLVLDSVGSPGVRTLDAILTWFALPLTAVTLAVSVFRHFRVQNRS